MEVFDKVNALGVYCTLLTGQEKKYVPFSNHIACIVEMVLTDELYDVAVIDEIQVMADHVGKLGISYMNNIMIGLSRWLKPRPCWEILKKFILGLRGCFFEERDI
ncbi:dexh-box atp-dependent rna helicase dexh18 [Quercus suber]|uniref:Dexh-box atp-dependent rna helicase dexh18 n=1 Tax=Quercus suber TaxID=58331 RepID=A0AAW0KKG3_QUESU